MIKGLPLKQGQFVKILKDFADLKSGIYEVASDVPFWNDFGHWGSVEFVGIDDRFFTHKIQDFVEILNFIS